MLASDGRISNQFMDLIEKLFVSHPANYHSNVFFKSVTDAEIIIIITNIIIVIMGNLRDSTMKFILYQHQYYSYQHQFTDLIVSTISRHWKNIIINYG